MTRTGSLTLGLVFVACSAALAQDRPPGKGIVPEIDRAFDNRTSDPAAVGSPAAVASTATATPTPPEQTTGLRRHRVKRGEDVMSIAALYGVTSVELMLQNRLAAGDPILTIGSELVIPNERPRRTVAVDLADGTYHWIQEGESALSVPRLYGIRHDALLAVNPSLQRRAHLLAGHLLKLPATADTSRAEIVGGSAGRCIHGDSHPGPAERPLETAPPVTTPQPTTPAPVEPVATTAPVTSVATPIASTVPSSDAGVKGNQRRPATETAAGQRFTNTGERDPNGNPIFVGEDGERYAKVGHRFEACAPPAETVTDLPPDAQPAWRSPWDGPVEGSVWDRMRAERTSASTTPTASTPNGVLPPPDVLGNTGDGTVEWQVENRTQFNVELRYEGVRNGTIRIAPGQRRSMTFPRGGHMSAHLSAPGALHNNKPVRPFAGSFTFEDGSIYGHTFVLQELPPGR